MTALAKLSTYGGLVSFSHTVFALPFAASAVVLAHAQPHIALTPLRVVSMLVAMVSARTSAMAWNRYLDRDVDAKNPRTASRHIPSGRVAPREALALTIGSGLLFVAAAFSLGVTPGVLAAPVLAVLLGYSYAKRFTWASHLWLGVALALAPGGAWIALGAEPCVGIVALMGAVVTWLFGFDVLYSLQDEAFDRAHGLHSVPARFGLKGALLLSAGSHLVTVVLLAATGLALHRGPFFALGVIVTLALLVYEHALVGKGDLTKIDKAFFDLNAYVSVGFFLLVLSDELARRHAVS